MQCLVVSGAMGHGQLAGSTEILHCWSFTLLCLVYPYGAVKCKTDVSMLSISSLASTRSLCFCAEVGVGVSSK